MNSPVRARIALVVASLMMMVTSRGASALTSRAGDDNENSTPTAWWIYTGQTLDDIKTAINARQARIVDIAVDNPGAFTVTYVRASGSYAKAWWFYVGIDGAAVTNYLRATKAPRFRPQAAGRCRRRACGQSMIMRRSID